MHVKEFPKFPKAVPCLACPPGTVLRASRALSSPHPLRGEQPEPVSRSISHHVRHPGTLRRVFRGWYAQSWEKQMTIPDVAG